MKYGISIMNGFIKAWLTSKASVYEGSRLLHTNSLPKRICICIRYDSMTAYDTRKVRIYNKWNERIELFDVYVGHLISKITVLHLFGIHLVF